MHGYGCAQATLAILINLKVSEAACVWMRECGCMGMDAPHATA
jgi:hypothetical protein